MMLMSFTYVPFVLLCAIFVCLPERSVAVGVDDNYVIVNDEVYLESTLSNSTIWDRASATQTKVVANKNRDVAFFDVFSQLENYKKERPIWNTTQNGRLTLSKMNYLILPIWFNDDNKTAADITKINTTMQQVRQYYKDMSWNQHEVSWSFLNQVELVNISRAKPTLDEVSKATQEYILPLGMQYPITHTGLIIAYNVAASGDMNFTGGWGVINGNVIWLSMPPVPAVARHELGHNYGHPHHGANTYDWRINRGSSVATTDGFDMMSGGKCILSMCSQSNYPAPNDLTETILEYRQWCSTSSLYSCIEIHVQLDHQRCHHHDAT
jgi:hypothetical protein